MLIENDFIITFGFAYWGRFYRGQFFLLTWTFLQWTFFLVDVFTMGSWLVCGTQLVRECRIYASDVPWPDYYMQAKHL